jgi:hypothetical protein
MKRKNTAHKQSAAHLQAVETQPAPERLDEQDMVYFQNVLSAQAQAQAAAQHAQTITSFFLQTIAPKYKLNINDGFAPDGTIIRGAVAKPGE